MRVRQDKVGLWMIGVCGAVGSTVALGVAALSKGLASTTGLVSELPPFSAAGLVEPGRVAIGGHEIRGTTLLDAVKETHARADLFDQDMIRACGPKLRAMQSNIRLGSTFGAGPTVRKLADQDGVAQDVSAAAAVERLSADIDAFRRGRRLDRVVVIHLASSEPPFKRLSAHARYDKLTRAMTRRGVGALPPSSIYALAAIEAGCPFINFTPSLGVRVPAIEERARGFGVPYMGNDGKTGETLVKSVLAPMFAARNLEVLSWFGQNILGNRDGVVLNDPQTRRSKIQSKDKLLSQIIGRVVDTHVSIDYVPSLDDWKVAWDFIHFRGFLGTRMNMQFTWMGSDSILAAPLVIDLLRFAARESRAGRSGPMRHLAFFFKDPIAVGTHELCTQWRMLVEYFEGACSEPRG